MVKALFFASYSVWSVDGAIVQMELFVTSGNEDDRTTQSESIKRQRQLVAVILYELGKVRTI